MLAQCVLLVLAARACQARSASSAAGGDVSPVTISTWFAPAVQAAHDVLSARLPAVEAVDAGCTYCEVHQCDTTVGYGHHPDTAGRVTLDALVMDGQTFNAGAVGGLRGVRGAFAAARAVLAHSAHTLLVGSGAADFAAGLLGQAAAGTETPASDAEHAAWLAAGCQPNYWGPLWANANATNACVNASCVAGACAPLPTPAPTPYPPGAARAAGAGRVRTYAQGGPKPPSAAVSRTNHDTIGMCALDVAGNIVGGGSSNGAGNKVSGRLGDVPVIGAGVYADNEVGCAGATGDGDLTMRFLPAYQAVEFMRGGMSPQDACEAAVRRIMRVYNVSAHIGLVCLNRAGEIGAAAQAWTFTYAWASAATGGKAVSVEVPPLPPLPPPAQQGEE